MTELLSAGFTAGSKFCVETMDLYKKMHNHKN